MAEIITLDPSEVATGRTSLEITPWVRGAGIDWGDASIEATFAEQTSGAVPVDYRIPPRSITIPLVLKTTGGTTFATIRSLIQAKVGQFQHQGGWIKRVSSSGGTVYADITTAALKLSGGYLQAHKDADIEAELKLEAVPDFYENEVTLPDHTETTATQIIFTETASGGDYPKGDRVRMVVDEDDADTQRGLFWHFRCRNYSSAATAAPMLEADALTPVSPATAVGFGSASVISSGASPAALPTVWTPLMNTNLLAGTFLTHTGSYRIKARVQPTVAGDLPELRLVWDVGDLTNPVENAATLVTGPYDGSFNNWSIVDLGEVRLDPGPVGTHRWQGQIQARSLAGITGVVVDKLWLINTDESSGQLQAPINSILGGVALSARDDFLQAAGALTGKTLPTGGTWAGAGDTDDFFIDAALDIAQRTAVSDTGSFTPNTGRLVGPSGVTALTNTAVSVDFRASSTDGIVMFLVARYADVNNFFAAEINLGPGPINFATSKVLTRIASTNTTIATHMLTTPFVANTWYSALLTVSADGFWALSFGLQGQPLTMINNGYNAALVTAGSLASGQPRFVDYWSSPNANVRDYDNFAAWAPVADAVMFPSQSVEISTLGITREDSAGAAYGPVSVIEGDLPRFPNQSSGGTAEVMVKASRGDLGLLSDVGVDNISARLFRRKSWLYLP